VVKYVKIVVVEGLS